MGVAREKLCPGRFGAKVSWSARLVGNPMPSLWANTFDPVTNNSMRLRLFTAFWRLHWGSYNLKFVHVPGLEGELPSTAPRPIPFKKLELFPRISLGARK